MTQNSMKNLLVDLGIVDEQSVQPYYPRVRDRDDVAVLRCAKSDIITDHMDISHYAQKAGFSAWNALDRKAALLATAEDTTRRGEQFKHAVTHKKWLDVGTGAGGILDVLAPLARAAVAVEPQTDVRRNLNELGYRVYPSVEAVPDNAFEAVTLFHVLEHLTQPIATLELIRTKMATGGKIIVEVPHARDFLLRLPAFRKFTLWSEHLVLHTRESLRKFLETAGFKNIQIKGFQRYPLPNHVYWFVRGKPGGHTRWSFMNQKTVNWLYARLLTRFDHTDTLIAVAQKL